MSHRGPDDEGEYFSDFVALGSKRLSVQDLSSHARMPMASSCGRYTITYNGELYNFVELRAQLIGLGYCFRSRSDTEVVLVAYIAWGASALNFFNGMYAFAIWDKESSKLFMARDRLGEKPLHLALRDNRLVFASEAHALLRIHRPLISDLNQDSINSYLAFGFIPPDQGIVRGLSKLPPGHYAVYDRYGLRTSRYWRVPNRELPLIDVDHREIVDHVGTLIDRSVRMRLTGDRAVGLFLSGGIDSGIIAESIARQAPKKCLAFTARYRNCPPKYDESARAASLAKRLGIDHEVVDVDDGDFCSFYRVIHNSGEPFADSSAMALCSLYNKVSEDITVVITGDGGDELFGGYANVSSAHRGERLSELLPSESLNFLRAVSRFCGAHGARLSDFIGHYVVKPVVLQYDVRNLWTRSLREKLLLSKKNLDYPAQVISSLLQEYQGQQSNASRHLWIDLHLRLASAYLVKADITSSMYGVESRSPYLDSDLVDFATRLPVESLLSVVRSKAVLRSLAGRRLSPGYSTDSKRGFAPDIAGWLRTSWKEQCYELAVEGISRRGICTSKAYLQEIFEQHMLMTANHAQRLLILMGLEVWLRTFVDVRGSA